MITDPVVLNKVLNINDILNRQLNIGAYIFEDCYVGDDIDDLIRKYNNHSPVETLQGIDFKNTTFIGSKGSGAYILLKNCHKVYPNYNLEDSYVRDYLVGKVITCGYTLSGRDEEVDTITGYRRGFRHKWYMTTARCNRMSAADLSYCYFKDTGISLTALDIVKD